MNSMAIATVVIGIFLFVLFQIIKVMRRQTEAAREVRQRLGFVGVESVDPTLLSRIAAIKSPKTGKVKLSKVYRRDQGSHVLYDCYVDHETGSHGADQCSVLVGRGWQLPSLRLLPRIGGESKGWGLLNRLTLLAGKHGGFEEVHFDNQPEFSKKYTALSRTPHEVTARIPVEVWRDLAAFPDMLFLEAEGDTIIFSSMEELTARVRGDFATREAESLTKMMETGRRLNSIFESCLAHVAYEPARSNR